MRTAVHDNTIAVGIGFVTRVGALVLKHVHEHVVTPRVYTGPHGIDLPAYLGPVLPFQDGWFPDSRGLRPCLTCMT